MLANKASLSSVVRASGNAIPVGRLIRAAGFMTALGGGALLEPVRRGMDEAAFLDVPADERQAWAGRSSPGRRERSPSGLRPGPPPACARGRRVHRWTRRVDIDRLPATDGMPAAIVVQRATGTPTTGPSAAPGRASWRTATPISRVPADLGVAARGSVL
jgi:hypothetical protein